jgi:hypothetical protein
MLKYPWKRDQAQSRLAEISIQAPESSAWRGQRGKLASEFEFFVEDEHLDDAASDAVGAYLYASEVAAVSKVAHLILAICRDLPDEFDDDAALRHPRWGELTSVAGEALRALSHPAP